MSTPRTDELYNSVCFFTDGEQAVDALADLRDLARQLERENASLKKDKEMLEMERCECLRTMSLALNNNAGQRENLRLLRILSRIRSTVDHSPDMSQATRLEWVGEYLDDALGKEAQP